MAHQLVLAASVCSVISSSQVFIGIFIFKEVNKEGIFMLFGSAASLASYELDLAYFRLD